MDETANLPEQTQLNSPAEGQEPAAQAAPALPELSDEQLASLFERKFNFKGNMDEIKQKFAPAPIEPSAEEKSAKELAEDKRLLDIFTRDGSRTIEQYSSLKGLLKEDDLAFGKTLAARELMEDGFSKEEAETLIKNRYFQVELDALDRDEFDSDEDFEKEKAALQKKIDFGNKKLTAKSISIKKQTEGIFNQLKQTAEFEDLQKQKEVELSSKVDDHISKMPRKLTLELGKSDNRQLDPIQYDVSDNDIAEIAQVLKDPSKRDEVLYDKEGNVNVAATAEFLLNKKTMQNLLKTSYLTGETRMTKVFRSVYPATSPSQVGVDGAQLVKDTKPGKIVKVGQPRVGTYPQTN